MNLSSVKKAESEVLLPTYDRLQILVDHGAGVYLYGADGRKYLDFLSGIGVNALGYSHPALTKVLTTQAKKLVHVSNLFFHPYTAELAKRLAKISGLDRVFFTNSGTEAWEGALKFARAYAQHVNQNGSKPRWRILALENSFHGRTMGSLATTGQQKYQKPFVPLMPGVEFVRFNDVADLKAKFDDTVCAVCMEPVQGEGGVRPISKEFMVAARELTKKSGALLILDEIQSGMGRTGKYFAYQHYGVVPDVVTLAKPIAGGLPLGAILTTHEVSSCLHPGMHGTTFGGGPLACAVALEVLNVIEKKKLLAHVEKLGVYFRKQLAGLQKKHCCIKDVRGLGLFVAAELHSADMAKAAVAAMLERNIIINRTNETVLRFLPPYIVEKKHIDQVIKALDQVLVGLSVNADKRAKASA
ncbi:MAG TPA: acetylornithine transaminase [Terriglobales bacterium]|nr:acetylornithine transaminase [Terriglobales bacterium]